MPASFFPNQNLRLWCPFFLPHRPQNQIKKHDSYDYGIHRVSKPHFGYYSADNVNSSHLQIRRPRIHHILQSTARPNQHLLYIFLHLWIRSLTRKQGCLLPSKFILPRWMELAWFYCRTLRAYWDDQHTKPTDQRLQGIQSTKTPKEHSSVSAPSKTDFWSSQFDPITL